MYTFCVDLESWTSKLTAVLFSLIHGPLCSCSLHVQLGSGSQDVPYHIARNNPETDSSAVTILQVKIRINKFLFLRVERQFGKWD